ncbi:MAG: DMT family transporter [Gammaproteobacteria bacterium]|nr:DMT family transporter [Gammaproteobacteria bacterium]
MAEIAALGAALCWALGTLCAADAARRLGGMTFTRWRSVLVLILLVGYLAVRGFDFQAIHHWPWIVASACVGIFISDSALFVGLARLGPRRNAIVFATNAPLTAILAWLFLGEQFTAIIILGCLLVIAGVIIAIVYGKRRDQIHTWESIQGSLFVGLLIGLLAALGQAASSLLITPVLNAGVDPATVAAGRIAVAVVALFALRGLLPRWTRAKEPISYRNFWALFASGLLGMAVGMTLLLYAFAHGSVGLSAILSSTTPVMLLPLTWWISRERPALGAWLGASLAVAGTAIILYTPV